MKTVKGTSGSDSIQAPAFSQAFGYAGNDTIDGSARGTRIFGGAGRDQLTSGLGGLAQGGADDDIIYGGTGGVLSGDGGNDVVYSQGRSTIFGDGLAAAESAPDDGADLIYAAAGDVVYGGGGDDLVQGSGMQLVSGDDGNDTIDGSAGVSGALLAGGQGNDRIVSTPALSGLGNEVWGDDVDDDLTGGNDTILSGFVDTVHGGGGNDSITADAGSVVLGSLIDAGGGNDTIQSSWGATVLGGGGNDLIAIQYASTVDGGDGFDTLQSPYLAVGGTFTTDWQGWTTYDNGGFSFQFRNVEALVIGDRTYAFQSNTTGAPTRLVVKQGQVAVSGGGTDTLSFADASWTSGVDARLASGTATGAGGAVALFSGIVSLEGTALADTLAGDARDNALAGGAGNDLFYASGGNDQIDGGAGTNTIDYADPAPGGLPSPLSGIYADLVSGSVAKAPDQGGGTDGISGIQNIVGTGGADTFLGNAADNLFVSNGGSDSVDGGDGTDTVDLSSSWFSMTLTLGADGGWIAATPWATMGLRNVERIIVAEGSFDLQTARTLPSLLQATARNTAFIGGTGRDTVDYSGVTTAVAASLSGNRATRFAGATVSGSDLFSGIENLIGSAQADTLTGDAGANSLSGGAGADLFLGDDGSDTIDGGAGIDTIDYLGGGPVNVNLATGRATGFQNDIIRNVENVRGSIFADTLTAATGGSLLDGSAGADLLLGGAGADTLIGGAGADTLDGGAGVDWLDYGRSLAVVVNLAAGTVTGGDAAGDRIRNIENVAGSQGADLLVAGTAAATLLGAGGADTLQGGAAADRLDGGQGDDWVAGRGGADVLVGGDGVDMLDYSASGAGVTVNLARNLASGGDAQGDSIVGFENATGSAFSDTLVAARTGSLLDGGAGADSLLGGTGADTLIGGAGADSMAGGLGADQFVFRARADLGTGAARDVIADFQTGADKLLLQGLGLTWTDLSFDGRTGILSLDFNKDRKADAEILLQGVSTLSASDVRF